VSRPAARRAAPIVAFSGPSGSGKTTVLLALVRELRRRGLRVAAVKHSGHPHGFDVPGKDSDRLLRAGAVGVAVQGKTQMALFRPPLPGGAAAIAAWLPPADLVLVEGWKGARLPRVEVHRRAVSRDFACVRGRGFLAVVTDEPPPRDIPTFAPGQVRALADLLCDRFGLPSRPRSRSRRPST
jgi:molybdopterin-guanine dinucleotide biosynthesis adapter protein